MRDCLLPAGCVDYRVCSQHRTIVEQTYVHITQCSSTVEDLQSAMQGLQFASLPPGLSDGTELEVLDLWGNSVLTGYLPPEYESWAGLRVFRWARNRLGVFQARCCSHCSDCGAVHGACVAGLGTVCL